MDRIRNTRSISMETDVNHLQMCVLIDRASDDTNLSKGVYAFKGGNGLRGKGQIHPRTDA